MAKILHIQTQPDDPLAQQVYEDQSRLGEHDLQLICLTEPDPDYRQLLEAVFEADSISVW
jgi:hypothetical protein